MAHGEISDELDKEIMALPFKDRLEILKRIENGRMRIYEAIEKKRRNGQSPTRVEELESINYSTSVTRLAGQVFSDLGNLKFEQRTRILDEVGDMLWKRYADKAERDALNGLSPEVKAEYLRHRGRK